MSLVQNPRVERGKILQNSNGQYFFVCSTCDYEFVTLKTFLNHQNADHDAKQFRMMPDDLTAPFTNQPKLDHKAKEARMESKKLPPSVAIQTDTSHDDKDKVSSDSTDDEPLNKIKAVHVSRTVSKSEARRTILVSPKPRKPTRNDHYGGYGKAKLPAHLRNPLFRMQTTEENSGKYICKNCSATFSTMVNLDSHEAVCMLLPIRFYCDRCNLPFDDEKSLQVHQKINHRS